MTRVREIRRVGVCIHHPEETAVIGDNDVRVFVVSQKRRDAVDNLTDVSTNEHAAVACDVVREGKLRKIPNAPGQQHAAKPVADWYSASSLVSRVGVCIALWIVKLVLVRFYVNVTIGEFAIIDFRTRYLDLSCGRLHGHV